MKIPNADKAVIASDKLQNYLLNSAHKRGTSKAKMLMSMGYSATAFPRLEADIRNQHLTQDFIGTVQTGYGTQYEIVAPLRGPTGKTVPFRSVWQIDIGTDRPRLITMYPE